jgi:hypothetical protein
MLPLRMLVKVRPAGVVRGWTCFVVLWSISCLECSMTRILSLSRDAHRGLRASFLFRAVIMLILPSSTVCEVC